MAKTDKIFIGINDQVIELTGEDKTNFIAMQNDINNKLKQELDLLQAQKELKISAYKKLGLTDEEINAII